MKPNTNFFKRMLSAHSGIGLAVGVLMYVICLTGTVAVFFQEFERWEQPQIEEFSTLAPITMPRASQEFYALHPESTKPLYFVLPTQALPRAHISDGDHEYWLNKDGTISESVNSPWTKLLTKLHVYLHLPEQLGLVIVGILGVMLTALILSGLFAHSRILKDAFRLRWGGTGQQQQIDIHNRLSVWAMPFHLVIAVTGAFFGIVGLLILSATSIYYQGDRDALIADVYGGDPQIAAHQNEIDFKRSFTELTNVAPKAKPIYAVIQNPKTERSYLEIAATLPERLIYSEIYRFDVNGNYINHQGFSDGPISRQVVYSVYRIHFGHFGGYPIKIAYVLLGLSLTVVCVTGINIWLNRRKHEDNINYLWAALVWGTPLALTNSAIASLIKPNFELMMFLVTLVFTSAWALNNKKIITINRNLVGFNALAIVVLITIYSAKYTNYLLQPATFIINVFVFAWFILCIGFLAYYRNRDQFARNNITKGQTVSV